MRLVRIAMLAVEQEPNGFPSQHTLRPLFTFAVAAVVLSACATSQPAGSQLPSATSPDLYHVGPVRVLLRPQPEVEFMCRLKTQQQRTGTGRILGCYVPREQAIISTPDPYVLLHEFKHYFEGPFHD